MNSRAGLRTTEWKTAKVGSAGLFETPRSRARKIPRFSNIVDSGNMTTPVVTVALVVPIIPVTSRMNLGKDDHVLGAL
jgi:hypothetical protein